MNGKRIRTEGWRGIKALAIFCGMGPPGELLKVKELFKGKKGKKVKDLWESVRSAGL